MWQLRLIIVLIGLVFIALVYLLSRQRKARRAVHKKDEPSLDGVDNLQIPASFDGGDKAPSSAPAELQHDAPAAQASTEPARASAAAPAPTVPVKPPQQLIIVLHVAGHSATEFDGNHVLAALQANGLQYGSMHVFHRLANASGESSVFSVAHMVEPGELNPDALRGQQIAGLTLFLVLPGPADGVAACADMIATARALATQLHGEVQNENRTRFTVDDAQHIRHRVLEFQTAG